MFSFKSSSAQLKTDQSDIVFHAQQQIVMQVIFSHFFYKGEVATKSRKGYFCYLKFLRPIILIISQRLAETGFTNWRCGFICWFPRFAGRDKWSSRSSNEGYLFESGVFYLFFKAVIYI